MHRMHIYTVVRADEEHEQEESVQVHCRLLLAVLGLPAGMVLLGLRAWPMPATARTWICLLHRTDHDLSLAAVQVQH